jgi:hypothetical protein
MMSLSLNVRFDFWEKIADTPIWLSFFNRHWKQPGFATKVKNAVAKDSIIPYESNERALFIPIYLLIDKTEDLVINDIANRIAKLIDELSM